MEDTRNVYEQIDFENGWAMSEEDKLFVLSFMKSCMDAMEEIGDPEFYAEYSEYYKRIMKNGVQAERNLIQKVAFDYSEAVNHEIYDYYDNDIEIVKFIEKSLLGKC